jgi:hypothetical protein
MFYVDGIVYQYSTGSDFTVVAAAHSVINHKFVAVKVRVYNTGAHSVTVKPEDVLAEDAVANHAVAAVSAAELSRKMRKTYNMARYSVALGGPDSSQMPITADMLNPQYLAMMQAMAARANGGVMAGGKNLLYTDTPGELDSNEESQGAAECDLVCRLRTRETMGTDALAQLQQQISPDSVERWAFLANTVPPRADVVGVLFYPRGKLSESALASSDGKKRRWVQLTVPVGGESFHFTLPVD